ncbi:MAG: phosphate acetyltransferase [Clostridia bacterium]|nr:phosphate acetyltransferase [Clostridia bacterium]MBR5987687.1 phosphate acetyltransferase [Clostridia bacterium]
MDEIKAKAAKLNKHIVLAEGEEERIIRAAEIISAKKIARLTLIGNPDVIKAKCPDAKLDGVTIVDPATSPKTKEYAALLFELRKAKGMTLEQAEKLALDCSYFSVLMIKAGDADGMVSGAVHSTGDTLRPALQIIKTAPGISTVSSCFIMCLPEGSKYGEKDVMVYGDCAVNIDPNEDQLADIAISTAESAVKIAGITPRVAMLSFSTKGSAKHDTVTKVQNATAKAHEKAPDLALDGELQLDAALVPTVAALKAPGSTVAGKANVLIFPDLEAGNIGYKLTQRLGGAEAIGPICQGLAAPVNDLSRGCVAEDVVGVVAVTAVQAGC